MADAVPNVPKIQVKISTANIKVATSNLFILDESGIPVETMTQLIFQDIGGSELASTVRNDSISGGDIQSQAFEVSSLGADEYSPLNIISVQGTDDHLFNSFAMELNDHIPQAGNGIGGSPVYLDNSNTSQNYNSIILDLINVLGSDLVEVQFLTFDSLNSDTIYL